MIEKFYWGEEQYGPFDTQEDGWPNAGQVMRAFREKSGMTAKAFGKLYGKAAKKDGKIISERWILEMELENKVPTDITRRRIIANLLHIPPILFGLADLNIAMYKKRILLPEVLSNPHPEKMDSDAYESRVLRTLYLHLTGSAEGAFSTIKIDRMQLDLFMKNMRGSILLPKVQELAVVNDLVAAKIMKDKGEYRDAHTYANHAILIVKEVDDSELLATAYYARGCVKLQWGQFGSIKQGSFYLDRSKIRDAIQDFQAVLDIERTHHISLHPQLHGFVFLQLSRSQALLSVTKHDPEITRALQLADRAESMVDCDTIDDLYTRMVVTGTVSGLHLGGYRLTRADIFNASQLPNQAIDEIRQASLLKERIYGKEETRNQAWCNIVLAKALIGLKEYAEAARRAKEALIACLAINSQQNITIISGICHELKNSSYREANMVKEIEELLRE